MKSCVSVKTSRAKLQCCEISSGNFKSRLSFCHYWPRWLISGTISEFRISWHLSLSPNPEATSRVPVSPVILSLALSLSLYRSLSLFLSLSLSLVRSPHFSPASLFLHVCFFFEHDGDLTWCVDWLLNIAYSLAVSAGSGTAPGERQ